MYIADKDRYNKLEYARCGKSGLKLPRVSLGLWHNFGDNNDKTWGIGQSCDENDWKCYV